MLLTKRPGAAVAPGSVSSRVHVTEPAVASAFLEMKTRPVFVAAHNVLVSLEARAMAETAQPAPAQARLVPR